MYYTFSEVKLYIGHSLYTFIIGKDLKTSIIGSKKEKK